MARDRFGTLGGVMGFGAAYDLTFGVGILLVPELSSRALAIPLPADPFYLKLNGVFLVLLAALLALGAYDPRRYQALAPISAGGRALGCLVFLLAFREGRPSTFLLLGLVDLAIGLATAAAFVRARRAVTSD